MTAPETGSVDLRLLPSAGMCWAATGAGILLGWRAALWIALGAVVVAVAVGWTGRRRVAAAVAVAALLVGAGFAAATAAREHAAATHPLARLAAVGGHATVTVAAVDDPKPVRSPAGDTVMIHARLRSIGEPGAGETRVGGAVLVFAPADGWRELLPGQAVTLRGVVSTPLRRDLTVAVLRVVGPPRRVEPAPWPQRAAGAVRARFAAAAAAALSPEAAGLLPGLVVGDTSALPTGVGDDFTAAGLTHLTAVSGLNVA
jgi:competence protein ComEC